MTVELSSSDWNSSAVVAVGLENLDSRLRSSPGAVAVAGLVVGCLQNSPGAAVAGLGSPDDHLLQNRFAGAVADCQSSLY